MRHLAIDFGLRRVGLAVSDPSGKFVTPLDVIEVTTDAMALDAVAKAAKEYDPQRLVIGFPLHMDGRPSDMSKRCLAFGTAAAKATGCEVVYVDERLTSFDAEQQLNSRTRAGEKFTRQGKKERRDALAAATFLREYLDGKLEALKVGQSP